MKVEKAADLSPWGESIDNQNLAPHQKITRCPPPVNPFLALLPVTVVQSVWGLFHFGVHSTHRNQYSLPPPNQRAGTANETASLDEGAGVGIIESSCVRLACRCIASVENLKHLSRERSAQRTGGRCLNWRGGHSG